MAKTQVNKAQNQSVAQIPEYLRGGAGNENVDQGDLLVPRLMIVQSQSPELDESDPKFIPGAQPGMMFNSLTKELYPEEILLVDTYFTKEYAVFIKRICGGGFKGTFPTAPEAYSLVSSMPRPEDAEVVEMASHYCLVLDREGKVVGELVVPMTSTKLKVSRSLNSMIRLKGGDRWSSVWVFSTQVEKNDKGKFYNFSFRSGQWVSQAVAETAKKLYQAVKSGEKKISTDEDEDGGYNRFADFPSKPESF